MEDVIKIVTILGGLLGIIAFFWNVINAYKSFLRLEVEVKNINSNLLIKTKIINTSKKSKNLTSAFLLINPEQDDPIISMNSLFPNLKAKYTNDFKLIGESTNIYEKNLAFIPLLFFTSEQVRIGDEEITYTSSVDSDHFDKKKKYSVRFFVFAKKRYHRSTQDLLGF